MAFRLPVSSTAHMATLLASGHNTRRSRTEPVTGNRPPPFMVDPRPLAVDSLPSPNAPPPAIVIRPFAVRTEPDWGARAAFNGRYLECMPKVGGIEGGFNALDLWDRATLRKFLTACKSAGVRNPTGHRLFTALAMGEPQQQQAINSIFNDVKCGDEISQLMRRYNDAGAPLPMPPDERSYSNLELLKPYLQMVAQKGMLYGDAARLLDEKATEGEKQEILNNPDTKKFIIALISAYNEYRKANYNAGIVSDDKLLLPLLVDARRFGVLKPDDLKAMPQILAPKTDADHAARRKFLYSGEFGSGITSFKRNQGKPIREIFENLPAKERTQHLTRLIDVALKKGAIFHLEQSQFEQVLALGRKYGLIPESKYQKLLADKSARKKFFKDGDQLKVLLDGIKRNNVEEYNGIRDRLVQSIIDGGPPVAAKPTEAYQGFMEKINRTFRVANHSKAFHPMMLTENGELDAQVLFDAHKLDYVKDGEKRVPSLAYLAFAKPGYPARKLLFFDNWKTKEPDKINDEILIELFYTDFAGQFLKTPNCQFVPIQDGEKVSYAMSSQWMLGCKTLKDILVSDDNNTAILVDEHDKGKSSTLQGLERLALVNLVMQDRDGIGSTGENAVWLDGVLCRIDCGNAFKNAPATFGKDLSVDQPSSPYTNFPRDLSLANIIQELKNMIAFVGPARLGLNPADISGLPQASGEAMSLDKLVAAYQEKLKDQPKMLAKIGEYEKQIIGNVAKLGKTFGSYLGYTHEQLQQLQSMNAIPAGFTYTNPRGISLNYPRLADAPDGNPEKRVYWEIERRGDPAADFFVTDAKHKGHVLHAFKEFPSFFPQKERDMVVDGKIRIPCTPQVVFLLNNDVLKAVKHGREALANDTKTAPAAPHGRTCAAHVMEGIISFSSSPAIPDTLKYAIQALDIPGNFGNQFLRRSGEPGEAELQVFTDKAVAAVREVLTQAANQGLSSVPKIDVACRALATQVMGSYQQYVEKNAAAIAAQSPPAAAPKATGEAPDVANGAPPPIEVDNNFEEPQTTRARR